MIQDNIFICYQYSKFISKSRSNVIWKKYTCKKSDEIVLSKMISSIYFVQLNGDESQMDLWILSRMSAMLAVCDRSFAEFDLHHATEAIQQFWIQELCDIYLVSFIKLFFLLVIVHVLVSSSFWSLP